MTLVFLIACAKAAGPATPVTLPSAPPSPEPDTVEVPAAVQPVRSLLQARHPADLPDRATLDAHGAPAPLHWLAENDRHLVIRERALTLLASYDDGTTVDVCRRVFRSEVAAPVRAAAIRCAAAQSDVDVQEQLLTALEDPDPRVGLAALRVLKELPGQTSALERALEDPSVPQAVRDAR